MNDSHLKRLGLVIGLVVVVLASALYLVAKPPSPSPAPPPPAASPLPQASATSTQPKVTWSIRSLQPILSPGESSSNTLSFVSSGDLTNVTVEAVPAIAPFVTVSPNTFASVLAGQPQSVHITFSIPQGTAFGTYDGTIHIRVGGTTFPQTLKVTVNVWQKFVDPGGRFAIHYPPTWTLSQGSTDSIQLYSSSSISLLNAGDVVTPPDVAVVVLANNGTSSLSDFVRAYRSGWYASYTQVSNETVDGHEAVLTDDSQAQPRSNPTLAVFVSLGSEVLQITGEAGTKQEFDSLVATLELP